MGDYGLEAAGFGKRRVEREWGRSIRVVLNNWPIDSADALFRDQCDVVDIELDVLNCFKESWSQDAPPHR